MPPKKAQEPEVKPLIGRIGTNLKIGIVGMPNVGKSTFFNILTNSKVAAENFPFCTIDPTENKYPKKPIHYASCITRRSFMKYIKGQPREEYNPSWPKPNPSPYPKPNIYYPFTEDTNPFERTNITDEGKVIFQNQRFGPPNGPSSDPYTDAKAKYLKTKPTSFIIFGKPDLNTSKLAAMIANSFNCVLISPVPLIQREMDLDTDVGKDIKKILGSVGFLGYDIIMDLIRRRLKMRDVQHKGYIVEGLPLIPNEKLDYSSYFDRNSCRCDKKSPCEGDVKKVTIYEEEIPKQINEVFKEWVLPPSIIIYATSPDEDVLEKRKHFRMNIANGTIVDTTLNEMNGSIEKLISQLKIGASISFHLYEELMNEERILDQNNYTVKLVSNEESNIKAQCDLYKSFALPIIDKWVLLYNPQNVIRVDARAPISRMFQVINGRLRLLPIPRVIVPHRMIDNTEIEFGGESPEAVLEFEGMSNKDVYQELMHRGTIFPRFPWKLSPWEYLCPVELSQGRRVTGLPKHTVRFMDQIYFLSSQEAVDLFLENPRPFLLPPYPRPICKLAVFGPNYSGKSELCRELARAFSGTVINVKEKEQAIVDERMKEKIAIATRENLKDVIKDLKDSLESRRESKELERRKELESWYQKMAPTVTRFLELLDLVQESSESSDSDAEEADPREELITLRATLKLHNLGCLEKSFVMQNQILLDNKALMDYAPQYLRYEEPPVRELNEFDPEVIDMLEDRVKYLYDIPIELTVCEKVNIIVESIKNVSREKIDENLWRDPSYIVNGMYTDIEIWQKVLESGIVFEDIIVLLDHDPYEYLINKWNRINKDTFHNEHLQSSAEYSEDYFENERLVDYINHLQQFGKEWNSMKDRVEAKDYMICDLQSINNVPKYVIRKIQDRYTPKPTIMSDEEKHRYKEYYELENLIISGEGDNEGTDIKENPKENYPFGESGYYCPVALMKHNVFWKGNEMFSVSYMNNVYQFSSEDAMNEFVENVSDFSIPSSKPISTIPPLRFCIIGPPGSGKSAIADALSREYGLTHVDYYDCFSEYMKGRAISHFSSRDLLTYKELPERIELPEDRNDRRYTTDATTVRYFIRQYWANGDTLPDKMARECFFNFFCPPFNNRGLILDGFPSCAQDLKLVFQHYAVPELIIELECSLETCIERTVPAVMEYWNKQQEELRQLDERRYFAEMEYYNRRREVWIRKMLQDRQKEKRMEEMYDTEYETELSEGSSKLLNNTISEDSSLNTDGIIELEELWQSENTEPELFTDWEDPEDVKERVASALEVSYANETNKINGTREAFDDESIPWLQIDTEKDFDRVLKQITDILDPYVFRDVSMFERTYAVDCETAERLLDCGYYLLSSFGRWCPVQIYEKKNPIQMFLSLEVESEIYPIIYRQSIYFLGGNEAVKAFRKNPFKYIEQDSSSPILPIRISIIGPPKCGKSTLAKRFSKKYGLKNVTRGTALRSVLKSFPWTNLAKVILSHLQGGNTVPDEYVIRAVEMFSIDPCAVSQGLVFDGFPSTRRELELLTFRGLQPMIVLDLKADLDFSLECLSTDDRHPTYSPEFFMLRYTAWKADEQSYRNYLKKYSKNVIELDASKSKAYTLSRAEELIFERFASMKLYFRECDYDRVHSLEHMCVSPYEYRKHQSQYERFCPLCLMSENALITSGPPPDSQGMVQFREHFYWICPKHLAEFSRSPLKYVPPLNAAKLPEDRPRLLDGNVDLECICWGSRLQAEGYCLVTYVDNLPSRRIVSGKTTLGVVYMGKLYLFCTAECREKFLMYYFKYADVKLKVISTLPSVDIRSLPDLGFLEQTVAQMIIHALSEISVLRPKIPGLSASASAAVYMAVFFKTHNTSSKLANEINIYETVNERMMSYAQVIKVATKNMAKRVNPFIHLPPYPDEKSGEDASRHSQVSSRMINMIKFRRTSATQLLVDPEDDPDY